MDLSALAPIPFVLVHLGTSFFPSYAADAIRQILAWNPAAPVYFICEAKFHSRLAGIAGLQLVDVAGLPQTTEHLTFSEQTRLDTGFRDGFWRFTTERMFVLHDFMVARGISQAIHIENDNTIYFSCDGPAFRAVWDAAPALCAPRHSQRSLTFGILFVKEVGALGGLCAALAGAGGANEMDAGYAFFAGSGAASGSTGFFKSCPAGAAARFRGAHQGGAEIADETDTYLFDAACYGQYLCGIDPRNGPSAPGFVNQDSFFAVNSPEMSYIWRRDEAGRRYPVILVGGSGATREFRLANLHIHSKNLTPALSVLVGDQGERFQIECDAWFATDEDIRYNPYLTPYINGKRNNPRPQRIFVYGHRLHDFDPAAYDTSYVLVTGNSDENIDEKYRSVFDSPLVRAAYCQNLLIDHPKCNVLPIGQANQQWPHGDAGALQIVARSALKKTKQVYFQFSPQTHHSRYACTTVMQQKGLQMSPVRPYLAYLIDLATHRYAICPIGNGADTHRFWECVYLDVVPIVLRGPLTERLQRDGQKMVLLDRWEDLDVATPS
jgi:hypothetical protein